MKFEWDSYKNDENIEKHKVSFDIAKTVFKDKFAKYLYDDEHSNYEDRFIIIGIAEIINQ
ncbi:MAG: BrnT family toxin [Oscillospiraceae bacterium]|nr:BrnT family toxin [Oscillospiraceae bacterium]